MTSLINSLLYPETAAPQHGIPAPPHPLRALASLPLSTAIASFPSPNCHHSSSTQLESTQLSAPSPSSVAHYHSKIPRDLHYLTHSQSTH